MIAQYKSPSLREGAFVGRNPAGIYIALMAARVTGPKKPTAGVIPFAFWNLMSAARVRAPKRLVSFPGEPAPLAAIW